MLARTAPAPVPVQTSSRPVRQRSAERSWRWATGAAVAVGVCFSVLLMSVSFGVSADIQRRLSLQVLAHLPGVHVGVIDAILAALTVLVTAAVLSQTAVVTYVLGASAMGGRREEIAVRRQSGVLRSRLVGEFLAVVLAVCLAGGVAGEVAGVAAGLAVRQWTVLPVRFTVLSVLGAFPVAVLLAVAATLVPAWQAANVSPALLRRD